MQSGGALSVTNSKVSGQVTATGAASVKYCGSIQSGAMNIAGTTGAVTLGDGGSCAADTISSIITISGTGGPVTVSGLKETARGTAATRQRSRVNRRGATRSYLDRYGLVAL